MKLQRTSPSSPRQDAAPLDSERPEATEPQAYAFGPFRLVPGERILRRGNQVLPLPPKAFETLLLLVRNPGHLMRKDDLMTALWPDSFVEEVSLASKISLLRKALAQGGLAASYIQTVPKIGYRFLPAVTRVWNSGSAAAISPPPQQEPAAPRVIRFIALPFAIMNGDERIAFLGHSLPEAISGSLAGLRSLTVRSSLLAARLAEGGQDPRHIAQEADVDMLLSGSILCEGDQLRVSAELVQAPTATLIGSYACQAARDKLFDLQDSLVHHVVNLLSPQLTEYEHRILTHDVPASARAYEFYLRGTHVERQHNPEGRSMARDLYRQCLDEDPDYAPAWARLGRCYRFLEKLGQAGPHNLELTQWAFRRAFALSPDLPIAHNLYTAIEADSGHAQEAMVRLLGQAEKHPNNPELFGGLVLACRYCGLLDESIRAHHNARRLDPRIVTSVAHTFFLLGDYQGALDWYPPGALFYLDLAALAALGREAEAIEASGRRSPSGGQFPAMIDSLRFFLQGDHARSLEIARQTLAVHPAWDPEIKFYLARQLARGGAHAEALHAIHDLVAEGFFCSTALQRDPWLRPLSSLPDFKDVLDVVLRREEEARAAFEAAGGNRVLS